MKRLLSMLLLAGAMSASGETLETWFEWDAFSPCYAPGMVVHCAEATRTVFTPKLKIVTCEGQCVCEETGETWDIRSRILYGTGTGMAQVARVEIGDNQSGLLLRAQWHLGGNGLDGWSTFECEP